MHPIEALCEELERSYCIGLAKGRSYVDIHRSLMYCIERGDYIVRSI